VIEEPVFDWERGRFAEPRRIYGSSSDR
jgi:hypothetical protein